MHAEGDHTDVLAFAGTKVISALPQTQGHVSPLPGSQNKRLVIMPHRASKTLVMGFNTVSH